jgi:GR25 family glycosyltransferase involved in LPS biosynthesis
MITESNQSGFKIVYINLDRSTQRRERIKNALDRYNLFAERIQAVDGSQLTDAELSSNYDPNKNSSEYFAPLKKSEIACFLSHRKALQQFVEEGASDLVLVLEDDIEFVCDPRTLLDSLAGSLAGKSFPIIVKLYSVRPISADVLALLSDGFSLTSSKLPPLGAQAQVFNMAGAKRFLESTERFHLPVDVAIQQWWNFPIEVLTVQPNLVTHQADQVGGSTITEGKRLSLRGKLIREISRPLYRLRVYINSRVQALNRMSTK